MTEQLLLELTGDELSRALGEVLQPETNKHNEHGEQVVPFTSSCSKCKLMMREFGVPYSRPTEHSNKPCKYADPIPLTPDNAFKWRDWAVEKFGKQVFMDALCIVYWDYFNRDGTAKMSFKEWLGCYIEPEHFLKAAALCETRSKK